MFRAPDLKNDVNEASCALVFETACQWPGSKMLGTLQSIVSIFKATNATAPRSLSRTTSVVRTLAGARLRSLPDICSMIRSCTTAITRPARAAANRIRAARAMSRCRYMFKKNMLGARNSSSRLMAAKRELLDPDQGHGMKFSHLALING